MTKLCHKMWIKEICILVKFQSQTPSGLGVIELLDGLREWIFAGIKLCDFAKGKSDFFGFWKLPVRQNFKKFDFAITLFHELKKKKLCENRINRFANLTKIRKIAKFYSRDNLFS